MKPFPNRVLRAALLEPGLFAEVGADPQATGQAAVVVLLSSLAAGVGRLPAGWPGGLFWGLAAALGGWALWAWLIWLIGARLLPEENARAGRQTALLRALGFASAPGLLRVLGVVPGLRWPAFLAASVWTLAAAVAAVRRTLGYRSIWRAAGVSLAAWVVQALVLALLLALLGARSGF